MIWDRWNYSKKKSQNNFGTWSERRGSNSRQPAWKAGALPTELLSLINGANISNKITLVQTFFSKKLKKFQTVSLKNSN